MSEPNTPPSPLTTASPEALTAMFEADPCTLTDTQFHSLILTIRARRSTFLAEEATKALKPKSTRTRAEPQPASVAAANDKPISEVNLDDL